MARKRNGRPWTPELAKGYPDAKPALRIQRKRDKKGNVVRIVGLQKPHNETAQESSHLRPETNDTIRVSRKKTRLLTDTQTGRTIADPMPTSKAARRKRNRLLGK